MKEETIKTTYTRRPRRKLDKHSITIPDASLSVRVLIDRTSKGLPVNARLSKHIPLPPDGLDMRDFDTGTEEILDVTDAVSFADELRAKQRYIEEEKEKARKEAIGQVPSTDAPPMDAK